MDTPSDRALTHGRTTPLGFIPLDTVVAYVVPITRNGRQTRMRGCNGATQTSTVCGRVTGLVRGDWSERLGYNEGPDELVSGTAQRTTLCDVH